VIATIVVVYTASPVHSAGPPGPGPETTPSPTSNTPNTPNTPPPVALPPPTSTPHTPSPGPVAVIPPPIDTSSTSLYLYIGLSILGLVVALAIFYAVRKKGGVSGILRVQRASKRVEAIRSSTDTNIQGVLKGVPFVLLCFAQYNNRELEKMFKNCQTVYPRELTPGNIVALIARFEQVERETRKDFKDFKDSKDSFVVRAFKKFSEFKSQLQPITQNRAIQIILGILSCPGNDRYKRGLDPSILPSVEQIQQATQRITDEQQHELDQLRTQQEQLRRQGFDQAAAEKQREIDLLRGQLEQSKQTERLLQTNQQTLQVEVSDLKTSRQSIQSQLTDANKALETERQKNVEFQKTLTGIQNTLTDIQNEQKTGEANRVDLQTRLNTLTAAQRTLEIDLAVARKKGILLQEQLDEAYTLNGNIQREKEDIQAKLGQTEITLATSKSDLRNLQEQFINMEKSLVEEQKNGSLTKTDLTNARLELERAKKDLESTKKQLETTIENLKTRKEKSKEIQQKLEDSENQLAKLNKTLAVVKNKLNWTRRMYDQTKAELTTVSGKHEKSRQDLIQTKAELEIQNRQLTAALKDKTGLKRDKQELLQLRARNEEQLKSITEQLKYEQQTAKGLEKDLEQLKTERGNTLVELAVARSRLEQIEKDLQSAKGDNDQLKRINIEIQEQKRDYEREANDRIKSLTNAIEGMDKNFKNLQDQSTKNLLNAQEALRQIQNELDIAKQNNIELKINEVKISEKLVGAERLNKQIEEELLTRRTELREMQSNYEMAIRQLRDQNADKETIERLKSELGQIKKERQDLDNKLKSSSRAWEESRKHFENVIDELIKNRRPFSIEEEKKSEIDNIEEQFKQVDWTTVIQVLHKEVKRKNISLKVRAFTLLLSTNTNTNEQINQIIIGLYNAYNLNIPDNRITYQDLITNNLNRKQIATLYERYKELTQQIF
jgi:chromosome segregation ATPase